MLLRADNLKSALKWLLVPVAVFSLAWVWYFFARPSHISGLEAAVLAAPVSGPIVSGDADSAAGFVAGISLHTEQELEQLFDRIEALLDQPRGESEQPPVSLVLHGPEVEFFALKNYDKYKSIVDWAAKLNALGALDISICRTRMQSLGIGADEVPTFLRQVPYGPDEVRRLLDSGFVYM